MYCVDSVNHRSLSLVVLTTVWLVLNTDLVKRVPLYHPSQILTEVTKVEDYKYGNTLRTEETNSRSKSLTEDFLSIPFSLSHNTGYDLMFFIN